MNYPIKISSSHHQYSAKMIKTGRSPQALLFSILVLGHLSSPLLVQASPCLNYAINPRTGKQECFDSLQRPSSSASPTSQSSQPSPSKPGGLNQKIYNYALNHLGKQVGDGECATLTYNALKTAQAQNFDELGPTGLDADYVWGKLIATITPQQKNLSPVQIGDIVQFRNVSTYKKITQPDGSWQSWTNSYAHHTAIVPGISGHQIFLLQQNVGNDPQRQKTVQKGQIEVDSLQTGTLWIYRPLPITKPH
ncbi:MAG: hypothetical protein VKL42_13465 [Snowella sp.]|nr:hypothetical protein [Snowella sp.]